MSEQEVAAVDTEAVDEQQPVDEQPVEQPVDEQPEDEQPVDEDGPLSKQAAKFRKRCRELETELAAAQETITGLNKANAERIAALMGVKPDALWAVTDLDSLTEDGAVNPERVKAAVRDVVDKLGVQPKVGLHVPGEGRLVRPPGQDGRTRWDAAFKPSYRR
jgi:hypothetical protein